MGYTTEFYGSITVEPPLNDAEVSYLADFAGSRRMDREEGPYFAQPGDNFGQTDTGGVRDHNEPPAGQPGLWCQWVPSKDGSEIGWDGGEKFYSAPEWMAYLINHFLRPGALAEGLTTADPRLAEFTFNHVCNGTIEAQGEDPDDRWALLVEGNEVYVAPYVIHVESGQRRHIR